jgi:hypothetical protein
MLLGRVVVPMVVVGGGAGPKMLRVLACSSGVDFREVGAPSRW